MFILWITKPHRWCLSKEMCSTCSTCHNFYHYPRAKKEGKRGRLISIAIVKLDLDASCIQNGPTLSLELTPCFLLPITINNGKSMIVRTQALLDSKASACFNNKKLVWQHNLALVEKATQVAVKVIDGRNFFSKPIMHELKTLTITIKSHSSKVIFNVISSLTNLIIIGLSWFILHNPWMDYKMGNLHFELINEITPKYEVFPTSMLDSEHDYTCENITRTNQRM